MSGLAEPLSRTGDRELPPLTLYVHFPWCLRKCPYCDFNSHPAPVGLPQRSYLDALEADLDADLPGAGARPVQAVFIGGGTPSLLSAEGLDRLLSAVRSRLSLVPGAEVTLEANPGAVEAGRFAEYRAAGVNRLSIGVQSFDDDLLARIGRVHAGAEARRAVGTALRAGFANLNLDLMYGLPGQSVAAAVADLEVALGFAPAHLSHYQLTLEPGTALHRAPPALPEEEAVEQMEREGRHRLEEAGYRRYEISNYARPGLQCRHNLNYWQFGDYLGIGPGAHGKLTTPGSDRVRRTVKHRLPAAYLRAADRVASERRLEPPDLALEFMLNALRLVGGVPAALFELRTGLPLRTIEERLERARELGLLVDRGQRIQATPRGLDLLNDLLALFLPEDPARA